MDQIMENLGTHWVLFWYHRGKIVPKIKEKYVNYFYRLLLIVNLLYDEICIIEDYSSNYALPE